MEPSGIQSRMYPNMLGLGGAATTSQMVDFSSDHPQIQLSMRQSTYPYATKPQPHPPSSAASDDDEPNVSAGNDDGDPKRKTSSPWHRMKWTDTMVKLLIMAVYYIGDDPGAAATSSDGVPDAKRSKLSASAAAAGALQKKGKWKSVSRAMMEKGYCVSPQQCEDKFNDLNKRYKRVNDILGRGIACRVVENQALLESMDVPPKLKEEVRKLLNSKHLFFREMCAYHNSCGHATVAAATPESAPEQHNPHPIPINHHHHQNNNNSNQMQEEEDLEEEEEEEEEMEMEEEDMELKGEMMRVMGDGGKSGREKRQWVAARVMEVEEEGLKFQREALEIEKQRMKWAIYSSKKEREMERMKLENQKRRLENQRMLLLLRHKEIEMASADPSPF